ncbi:hypothetical protein WDU94_008680, partial [Cyamophila willieti]
DKGAFSCEPCSRGFATQELLDSHLAEHVTCGIDGCMLSAHPGVLEVHVRFQHRTGLFKQINSAELDQWIADRKKRFPTLKTIGEKEQARQEMESRGECYEKMSKPFNRQSRFEQRKGSKRGGKNKNKRKRTEETEEAVKRGDRGSEEDDDPESGYIRMKKFCGLGEFVGF